MKSYFFIVLLIFCLSFCSSKEVINDTQQKEVLLCIEGAKDLINEFNETGFNFERINDSLKKIQNLYDAQIALGRLGKKVDFKLILSYCSDLEVIKKEAYSARDELYSLEKFYEIVNKSGANMAEADIIISEIKNEINDERYELARQKINLANQKISEIQASATTLNLFYSSTTRSLGNFIKNNWIIIVSVLLGIVLFILIFEKKIMIKYIKFKMDKLKLRKQSIEDLIKQAQRDYFHEGKISDNTYAIKTKKFAELIRDIDRQIPLLNEELVKVIGRSEWKKQQIRK